MARVRAMLAGILLAFSPSAFALNPDLDVSQYSHFSWKYRDGFARGPIYAIAQTSDGYLWLGTEFGLFRFDGVKASPWQPSADQHLPSSDIVRLLAARGGTLWIGTQSGLASWKDGKLTQYAGMAGLSIQALEEDHEGSIWVGAFGLPNGKLCEIRNGNVRCHPEIGGLGYGVSGLHEDGTGNLWVGLLTGVWRWKPGPPEFYAIPGQPDGIRGMVDGEGGLLIATIGGVKRLADGKPLVAYPLPSSMQQIPIRKIFRDRDGGLWIGTAGRGVVHIHQEKTDVFSRSDGLSGNDVYPFLEDREGNVWVATGDGLDRFRELPVATYSVNQGLSNAPSGAVLGAQDGSVWFTTRDGLDRLNKGQVTVYRERRGPTTPGVREIAVSGLPIQVESLFQDSRHRIWISTLTGVGYLENDRFVLTSAPGGYLHGLAEDVSGNLWIANQQLGLIRLSARGEVQQIPWAVLGHEDHATNLAADPQGGLWLGFYNGGIAYFNGGQVRGFYSPANGLAGNRVNQLRFDREGALWVATEGGVSRLDGGVSRLKDGRIATLTSKNGLPCDAVQWTMEDNAQSIWLNMPCGLVRTARSELDAWVHVSGPPAAEPRASAAGFTIHPTVFDSSDGVRSRAVAAGFTPHVARSPDGRLWFSTTDGLSVIDPSHLPSNKLPPPVHIESVKINGKEAAPDEGLKLSHNSNDLEIDYTALSFTNPDRVLFRYKLEGKDAAWQDVGSRRQAYYAGLPPKTYRFRVMASNNDGIWNEAGGAWKFTVVPAYYQTIWFQALCVLAGAGMLWLLYRLRLHQMAREFNVRLEERVSERTRLARDLHDTLLQSFHGLMLRFQAVSKLLPEGKAKEQLEKTLDRADQAIAEGRSAVYDLRSSATTTNELSEALNAVGNEFSTEDAAEFDLVVEGPSRDLHPIIRDEVYRISREALRNAFKHARARHIEAEISYGERAFRLRIRDDGEGIPAEVLEQGRPGHYGLPGMRERARQVGADLTIWSRAGTGTEIDVRLPGSIAYGTTAGRSPFRLFRTKVG